MFVKTTANGYLYSTWTGLLKVYEGYVDGSPYRHAWFRTKDTKKLFQCHHESGVVHNGVVWLEDRDDEYARKLLIEFEEARIATLKEQIERLEDKIKILKVEL